MPFRCLVLGAFLLVLVPQVPAQQKALPTKYTFSGFPNATDKELMDAAGLKPGVVITPADMDAAADQLSQTGMFSEVKFRFQGNELHFDLKPAVGLGAAYFENFPWWDSKTLTELVEARTPLFHGFVAPDSGLEQQIKAVLTTLVSEKGVEATVVSTSRVDSKTGEGTGVAFHIQAPPVETGEVKFKGVSADLASRVSAIERAAAGQTYNSATEEVLRAEVRNLYRRLGYLEVAMTGFAPGTPEMAGGKVIVPVSATIEPGGQYRLSSMTLTGDVLITHDEFAREAKIHPGDIVNEDLIRQTLAAVGEPYKERGYLRATIGAAPTYDHAQHTVSYVVTVIPRDIYHLGKVGVENLNEERKAAFVNAWQMRQGDVYNANYTPTFLDGIVKSVPSLEGWTATYKEYEHQDSHVIDLLITFDPGKAVK